jgi:paraquat-inducible protein B
MSAKPKPSLIGGFIVGAVILLVLGLAFFGGGKYFQQTISVVAHFDGSLAGLRVGAPVNFRGVQMGEVKEIRLVYDPRNVEAEIPVVMELYPVIEQEGPPSSEEVRKLIDAGLRAKLVSQSFVTGQLAIELDFLPNTPAELHKGEPDLIEVPTVPSDIQQIKQTLEQLDIEVLVASATRAMKALEGLATAAEQAQAIERLVQLIDDLDALTQNTDARLGEVTRSITATTDSANELVAKGDGALTRLEGDIDATLSEARSTLSGAETAARKFATTLDQAAVTLKAAHRVLDPNAPMGRELRRTIVDIGAAARSLRALADALERNPSALLTGKK